MLAGSTPSLIEVPFPSRAMPPASLTTIEPVNQQIHRPYHHSPCLPSPIMHPRIQPDQLSAVQPRWCNMTASTTERQPPSPVIAELITLTGSVNEHVCERPFLIDSGATCNFVDNAYAERVGLAKWSMPQRIRVRTADGKSVICAHIIPDAVIAIDGHISTHDLVVMPSLDAFDVVLGRAFLQRSKAIVHHETGRVIWPAASTPEANAVPDSATSVSSLNPWAALAIMNDNDLVSDASTKLEPVALPDRKLKLIDIEPKACQHAPVRSQQQLQPHKSDISLPAIKPVTKPSSQPSTPATPDML